MWLGLMVNAAELECTQATDMALNKPIIDFGAHSHDVVLLEHLRPTNFQTVQPSMFAQPERE